MGTPAPPFLEDHLVSIWSQRVLPCASQNMIHVWWVVGLRGILVIVEKSAFVLRLIDDDGPAILSANWPL